MNPLKESGAQLLVSLRLLKKRYTSLQTEVETRIESIRASYALCKSSIEFCELDESIAVAVKQLAEIKQSSFKCDADIRQVLITMSEVDNISTSISH